MQKDFLTITPDSGEGSQEVTVQAGANYGNTRSTTITISGGYRSNYRCESGSRTFYSV